MLWGKHESNASLADALKDIAAAYEIKSGDRIVFNFGASSMLARQIHEGAPADIFFSADEATMDDRGYVRIVGRLKDMLIVGGFNVYPAEVENALLAHDAIGQVAVIGVPDERMGEVAMAWVVAASGQALDPAEIIAWSRQRMANYKAPRYVTVVDSLPINAAGKVVKDELRDRATAELAGS